MIKTYDYAYIVKDKDTREVGLSRGDLVMVVASKAYPIKKSDPYVQRVFTHVIKVDKDGTHYTPAEDNEYRFFLIDPRNLQKVDANVQEELEGALKRQYETPD